VVGGAGSDVFLDGGLAIHARLPAFSHARPILMNEESLRNLIREKLASGLLPGHDCTKILGGPSNGETCDACGATLAKSQLVMECIGEHYPKALQFHVRCFYIWDSERGTPVAEPTK
jgi:hypothetical protein